MFGSYLFKQKTIIKNMFTHKKKQKKNEVDILK